MVERFTNTLELDVDQAKLTRALSVYLVLHMDHGGGNLSTFVGKAVASGHATLYSAMASSMNALSGPLHGRANQSCLEFVLRVGTSDAGKVEEFVRRTGCWTTCVRIWPRSSSSRRSSCNSTICAR